MEEVRKENCVIVILDENNQEKGLFVSELILNETWLKYKTKDNWITIPISRVVKIKEDLNNET